VTRWGLLSPTKYTALTGYKETTERLAYKGRVPKRKREKNQFMICIINRPLKLEG